MWDEVLGHQQNKEFLQKLLKPGSRPHALLFYGMGGIGKKMLALHFAKTFLCKSTSKKPCGICESCRLIDIENNSFAHPDFYLLTAEEAGKDIKIEQVKEMAKQAAFAPVLSEHKVCIIDDAGQMTAEAANSLLKLLEEPPPGWLFILITQQAERLLPTVLSRVVRLRFDAQDSSAVRQILKAKGITQNTQVLAALAGGSPGRALSYNQADIFAIRREALDLLKKLPLQNPFGYIAALGWGEKYDRAAALLLTEQFIYLLRDVLLLQSGAGGQVYNTDIMAGLDGITADWPLHTARQGVNAAQEAWQNINKNVSAKNVLEALVLKLDLLRKE
jgi:DNA polymerase-3 subunit delta'